MILDSKNVIIFTDGSSRGNPGPGGFAAIIIMPQNRDLQFTTNNLQLVELGGRETHTTNNRMEIKAAIEALSYLSNLKLKTYGFDGLTIPSQSRDNIKIYTDSSYVLNGITKWIHGWKRNGWKTKAKEPVENQDLWESLDKAVSGKKIEWKLVGGHIGLAGNERCDEIATAFADNLNPELYVGPVEKYSIKNILNISFDISKENKKSENRNHAKAKAYSYVSLVDGVIKIHKTWPECEDRVKGKKARYKKAISAEDEKEIKFNLG